VLVFTSVSYRDSSRDNYPSGGLTFVFVAMPIVKGSI
jgi:hypothetical protein